MVRSCYSLYFAVSNSALSVILLHTKTMYP